MLQASRSWGMKHPHPVHHLPSSRPSGRSQTAASPAVGRGETKQQAEEKSPLGKGAQAQAAMRGRNRGGQRTRGDAARGGGASRAAAGEDQQPFPGSASCPVPPGSGRDRLLAQGTCGGLTRGSVTVKRLSTSWFSSLVGNGNEEVILC